MKKIFAACAASAVVLLMAACKDNKSFNIEGNVEHADKVKYVYLLKTDTTGMSVIDSTTLSGGQFKFKGSAPYENLYKLRMNGDIFDIVVKNGDDIKFKTDLADSLHKYDVKGSDVSEKIKDFNNISSTYGAKNSKLADEYSAKAEALGKESDSLINVYRPLFQKNIADYSAEVMKFVEANKDNLAGFFAAASLDRYKYEQQMVSYADEIKDKFKDNPTVQAFIKQMDQIKPISIGHKAPEFTIKSIDGKDIKLSDYKGKYVMLDFWASWCVPCRHENPNVVKQHAAFHQKGFNILGISLDTEKAPWEAAIKADKLTWSHGSDLQRFDGPTEHLYRIEAIPSNFIIDPNGVIVAKNITGSDLEDFLKKTFK
ncbi:AhpC/TSA family protein [Mucilaginibacter sp. 21P]|uniref:TlpA disulfide reductase family protein n=1 Tax=Mucilaginibacter sp. 21P TaxID=2778902 RepID=UPI001C57218E|nr:TlpA disulfide reductase family protein [Mucilaginibacter sp. 21P]QXV64782.1 AhpC/TSA family protein [Mucilaginibacter sp. 21P]